MILNEEEIAEFKKVCAPVAEWLQKNFHPCVQVTIDRHSAEFSEGKALVLFDAVDDKQLPLETKPTQ